MRKLLLGIRIQTFLKDLYASFWLFAQLVFDVLYILSIFMLLCLTKIYMLLQAQLSTTGVGQSWANRWTSL